MPGTSTSSNRTAGPHHASEEMKRVEIKRIRFMEDAPDVLSKSLTLIRRSCKAF
jgi:hypothetical protein